MSKDRATTLDQCLYRLGQGESLDSCLADQDPQAVPELRSILEVAQQLHGLASASEPSPRALAAGRQRFLEAAVRMKEEDRSRQRGSLLTVLQRWFQGVPRGVAAVAVVFLMIAVLGGGTIVSARSLPGDALYPVKLVSEDIQLFFTLDPAAKLSLRQAFDLRRRDEVSAVANAQRSAVMTLRGRVESTQEGVWVIWGLDLTVNEETKLPLAIGLGDLVDVRLRSSTDGGLLALEITLVPDGSYPTPTLAPTATFAPTPTAVPATPTTTSTVPQVVVTAPTNAATRTATISATSTSSATALPTATATRVPTNTPAREVKVRFSGVIERIDGGTWYVGGQVIHVDGNTHIDESQGGAQTGTEVTVVAAQRSDGTLLALEITTKPVPPPEPVEFQGLIERWGATEWVVGGRAVRIVGDTRIEGSPETGLLAMVKALKHHNGTLEARRIVVVPPEEVQFEGRIQFMSADHWMVEGTYVRFHSQLSVVGTPTIGARVEVEGTQQQPDGSVLARKIVVVGSAPTATP